MQIGYQMKDEDTQIDTDCRYTDYTLHTLGTTNVCKQASQPIARQLRLYKKVREERSHSTEDRLLGTHTHTHTHR
jgi:hypothetical protein